MKPEDAEEYTAALGQVFGGGWRQIELARRLGVPKALGLSIEEWVSKRLGGYVQLSVADRRAAAVSLKADGMSTREIGAIVGVDHATVVRDLQDGASAPVTAEKPRKTAADGAFTPPSDPLDMLAALAISDKAAKQAEREDTFQARKASREQTRVERVAPPLPDGIFRVIYADPPWQYEHVETENRAIENQYPTMTIDDICDLRFEPGGETHRCPAADDAVLFLWATSPKLAEAMRVVEAWGFTYRTCAVWDKEQIGMGYYFRQQHELLLVGARGSFPVPDPATRVPSVIRSRREQHSRKPAVVKAFLESMYPHLTKLDRVELFTRDADPKWSSWGNEPVVIV